LKGFKTEQNKVISLTKEDQTLRNLFITQDEQEAIEEFEKEKDEQVENELGKKVEVPKVARGWNEWAGDGVNEGQFKKRADRIE
jgi:U3 small nucleolar RNA-associated protein 14